MTTHKLWQKISLLTATSVALVGCGSLLSPVSTPPNNSYLIAAQGNFTVANSPENLKELTVYIGNLAAPAPFDTNQMIYSTAPMLVNAYSSSTWSTDPSVLIIQSIAQNLGESHIFKHITTSNFIGYSNYRLIGQLGELIYRVDGDNATTNLTMTFALLSSEHNSLVDQKTFRIVVPSEGVSPSAYALSTNQATNLLSQQLAEWLIENLKNRPIVHPTQSASAQPLSPSTAPSVVQEVSNTPDNATKNATPNN